MNRESPSLDQLQRWMHGVITNINGVAAGMLQQQVREQIDVPPESLAEIISPSQQLSSLERLTIYQQAYFGRLLECLRGVFSMTTRLLGEEAFDALAVEYLQHCPSQSYTLGHLGDRFADFLESIRPGDDAATMADFVVDLVRLEWAISEVFDGPGMEQAAPFDPAQLQALPPDRRADVCLTPAPCLRLLKFRFPINECYTQLRRDEQPALPAESETYLALSRRDYVVQRFGLQQAEYVALKVLASGESIGEALSQAVPVLLDSSTDDRDVSVVHEWFQGWARAGFFAAT